MKATNSTVPGVPGFKVATPIGTFATPAACSAKPEAKTASCHNTHDGKLVSIIGNKLVMTSHEGQEYAHTVAADAKVCCDGNVCKSEELKAGSKIRLTTASDDHREAVSIESLDKHVEFAGSV
jgi:hypothetical protein